MGTDMCILCGGSGQACCPNNGGNPTCNSGFACTTAAGQSTCTPCGGQGETCCGTGALANRTCRTGLVCANFAGIGLKCTTAP
jgi:hypothetical protein